jgi:hypothetical protein
LIINDEKFTKNEDKANLFASNLENKFKTDMNDKFSTSNKKKVEDFFQERDFESRFTASQKLVNHFSMQELLKALKEMNSKTSLDPYGLTNKMLNYTGEITRLRILEFFNDCLDQRKVPKNWKFSVISMLLKPNQDDTNINSYRPISMTSCLARLFERMVLARLQQHLKTNKILITNQSGFRKARQTRDNLFALIQGPHEGFNDGEKTITVFFDIAAAFDKVWHQGLIYKLYQIKVPFYLIMIIWDLLKNRTFSVKVEEAMSDKKRVEAGVPQGGVLSPNLFSIYINDIPLATRQKEKTLLFADDIVYFFRFKFKDDYGRIIKGAKEVAEKTVQEYLDRLEAWMNNLRLSLAPKKCSQITFTRARDIKHDAMSIKLHGEIIPEDVSPKFLGITFDQKMKFNTHIEKIKRKIVDRMNLLKILSFDKHWRLSVDILIKMYKVLVRSVIDYANVIAPVVSVSVMEDLEVLQNNALRIILKKRLLDKVPIIKLREMANVGSIKDRLNRLLNNYYDQILLSNNPLIMECFEEY